MKSLKQIGQWLRSQSVLMRIIYVNAGVWVALRLAVIIGLIVGTGMDMESTLMGLLKLPPSWSGLAMRPWTALTYMFTQYDPMHALFNMLWLYWFGIIFISLGRGARMLALYIAGGLFGALLYLLASFLGPGVTGAGLIGASASVIAIVTATAVMVPNYRMHLLFLGPVKLKWVAIVTIGLDLLSVTGGNAGGHIAHLGGALAGAIYALQARHRLPGDLTSPFAAIGRKLAGWWRSLTVARRAKRASAGPSPKVDAADRADLDRILDKIKRSGYASLTAAERRRLFDVSNNIK